MSARSAALACRRGRRSRRRAARTARGSSGRRRSRRARRRSTGRAAEHANGRSEQLHDMSGLTLPPPLSAARPAARRLALGGDPLAPARAQQHVEDRREEDPEERDAEHPGEHRDAHRAAHLAARAAAEDERQHAGAERDRGHQDRTQPHAAGVQDRVDQRLRPLLEVLRELDDQDRVLARQADEHDQRHLREDVEVARLRERREVRDPHAEQRRQHAHRHDRTIAIGRLQLSYCAASTRITSSTAMTITAASTGTRAPCRAA